MRRGVLGLLLTLTLAFGGIALTALPAGASHTVDHANFLCFAGLNQAENPFVITGSSGDFFWAIPEYYVVPASGNAFWEFGAWQYLQQGSDWREYPSGAFTTGQFFPNNISSGSNVAVCAARGVFKLPVAVHTPFAAS